MNLTHVSFNGFFRIKYLDETLEQIFEANQQPILSLPYSIQISLEGHFRVTNHPVKFFHGYMWSL